MLKSKHVVMCLRCITITVRRSSHYIRPMRPVFPTWRLPVSPTKQTFPTDRFDDSVLIGKFNSSRSWPSISVLSLTKEKAESRFEFDLEERCFVNYNGMLYFKEFLFLFSISKIKYHRYLILLRININTWLSSLSYYSNKIVTPI